MLHIHKLSSCNKNEHKVRYAYDVIILKMPQITKHGPDWGQNTIKAGKEN